MNYDLYLEKIEEMIKNFLNTRPAEGFESEYLKKAAQLEKISLRLEGLYNEDRPIEEAADLYKKTCETLDIKSETRNIIKFPGFFVHHRAEVEYC